MEIIAREAVANGKNRPLLRIPKSELDRLMKNLEVDFADLVECSVSPGYRLSFRPNEMSGMHYTLTGGGQLVLANRRSIPLIPHTLVVIPPRQSFAIEVPTSKGSLSRAQTIEAPWHADNRNGGLRNYAAGAGEPRIRLICGRFHGFYGRSIDLFASLTSPIVERFEAGDRLDEKVKSALDELKSQEAGMGAMAGAMLKQVLVTLLRRSLYSGDEWVERFALLADPRVARAFADMVERPGAPHSITTLSQVAGLSRSNFMARFVEIFGRSPMVTLRELRMDHAATLLMSDRLSTEKVAYAVGYASRSSFTRAFRKTYGARPSNYGDA